MEHQADAPEPQPGFAIELHEMDGCTVWVADDLTFAVVNSALPGAFIAGAIEALMAVRKAMGR